MPITKKINVFFLFWYFKAVGSSSITAMLTIIPTTIARIFPMIMLLVTGPIIRYAMIAPNGSDIPDIRVNNMAFFLFLVAL